MGVNVNFTRRMVHTRDLNSSEAYRSVATNPKLNVLAVNQFNRKYLEALVVLLGDKFASHVFLTCTDKTRLSLLFGQVDNILGLFDHEFEEDATIDLQLTIMIEIIKILYPFNAKKIQSRTIEIRKFLRDFTGWTDQFKLELEEQLFVEKHLDNRFAIHLFSYRA